MERRKRHIPAFIIATFIGCLLLAGCTSSAMTLTDYYKSIAKNQFSSFPSDTTSFTTPINDIMRVDVGDPIQTWQQGIVPRLYQFDPSWAEHPYGGEQIYRTGCGPTCLSMVTIALTGRQVTPIFIANYCLSRNYYTEVGTDWSLMTYGAADFGLYAEQFDWYDTDEIIRLLSEGHPMIASVHQGDFTDKGHFIVLSGVNENGEIIIRDPNSVVNTNRPWDLNIILEQTDALWVYYLA